ncbi:MAG: hypothetical protein IRZ02_00495 [Acidothermus sp.]|nr:hypothetical protein [Acidothermus sp.]MCL6537041.1 hypothetical protein [Acidothermus sp.]
MTEHRADSPFGRDQRWSRLFNDLEGQLAAAQEAADAAEAADRVRAEVLQIRLIDRLWGSIGRSIRLRLGPGDTLAGRLVTAGEGWVLLEEGDRETLVFLPRVQAIDGLDPRTAASAEVMGPLAARVGPGHTLRRMLRDRAPVGVRLDDGTILTGTLDRVGRDFIDLAQHDPGDVPRARAIRSLLTIPWPSIVWVRRL